MRRSSSASSWLPATPTRRVTKAWMAWPFTSCGRPTTAASVTSGCETSADSTSAVPSRWPDTLITSSVRPMIQK